MTEFVAAGAGFLLAVLWFDLMFDVQAVRHRGAAVLPAPVLDSIASYYARVTTGARPMNRLVALVMLATIGCAVGQAASEDPAWTGIASAALALTGVSVAVSHTIPASVRLGARSGDPETESALARSILRDHLVAAAAIAGVLAIQLGFGP